MDDLRAESLDGLVRIGTVTDRRMEQRLVRVLFADTGYTSGWLPVLINRDVIPEYEYDDPQWTEFETEWKGSRSGYADYTDHKHKLQIKPWMPKIGDEVLCLYLPVFSADGFVLGDSAVAEIGYLGTSSKDGVIFKVSRETVETVSNMTWSGSARYATHQRHLTHALTEFTGLDPDKITFDITLLAELKVEPMRELEKLWKFKRQGTALQFVLGSHGYGKYRWVIQSLKIKAQYFDAYGDLYCAVVSVGLLEYLSKDF